MDENIKIRTIGIVNLILLGGLSGLIFNESEVASAYTSHDPIYINGNENFTIDNGVTGGNGTFDDPFIIEDLNITTSSAAAIEIKNTDAYLIIRNVLINGSFPYDGISFTNVTNGRIENTTVENMDDGILLANSNHIVVVNNTIESNTWGITLTGSDNNTIKHNDVNKNSYGLPVTTSNYNLFLNNTIMRSTYKGIYILYSVYNNLTGNDISENGDDAIELGWDTKYNRIADNVLQNNGDHGIYVFGSTSYNDFINNTIKNNNGIGIDLTQSTFCKIQENLFFENEFSIVISFSDYSQIVDNTLLNSPGPYQIKLYQSRYATMSNNIMVNGGLFIQAVGTQYWDTHEIFDSNTVSGKPIYYWKNRNAGVIPPVAGQVILVNCSNVLVENQNLSNCLCGLYLAGSDGNEINNNTFNFNNFYGIYLDGSSGNNLTGNNVSSNYYGIFLSGSKSNIIENNFIDENSDDGIYVDYSYENNIVNNTLSNNGDAGIEIRDSNFNIISGCTISNNDWYGFYIFESYYNQIYHNNMIDNYEQASLNGGHSNTWYDEYPSGGNYWSDYIFQDIYSGETQNEPGPDGIGDWAYHIEGSVYDIYPLFNPYGMRIPFAPENIKTQTGKSFINLSWEPAEVIGNYPVTNYRIYRGTDTGDTYYKTEVGDQLFINDTTVLNGLNYYYQISAVNEIGVSKKSKEATAMAGAVPNVPEDPEIRAGVSFIEIKWSRPQSDGGVPITNYRIYRGSSSESVSFHGSVGNITKYNDTSVTNGKLYYYRISAVNDIGEGPKTEEVSATPGSPPSKVYGVQVIPSTDSISITWDVPDHTGGLYITHYNIYKGLSHEIQQFYLKLENILYFTDTNVTAGLMYYYRVSAVNDIGEGPKSEVKNGIIKAPPGPPLNFTAEAGDAYVNLTWLPPLSDGGSPIRHYYIQRSTKAGETDIITKIWADEFFFNDTNVENGITYHYRIQASNTKGKGALSIEISATPKKFISTNLAPSAQIIADNTSGLAPFTVKFTGSGFDADGFIESYFWDFGDGNTSNQPNPEHLYRYPGTYYVKLTVLDNNGASGIALLTVTVKSGSISPPSKPSKTDDDEKEGSDWAVAAGATIVIGLIAMILIFFLLPAYLTKKLPEVEVEKKRLLKEIKYTRRQMARRSKIEQAYEEEMEEE